MEDRNILQEFLRRYLKLLDRRVHRLDLALTTGDPDAWIDAVLSLKTSSAMAGTTALAQAHMTLTEDMAPGTHVAPNMTVLLGPEWIDIDSSNHFWQKPHLRAGPDRSTCP